jgi:hypothetical protein
MKKGQISKKYSRNERRFAFSYFQESSSWLQSKSSHPEQSVIKQSHVRRLERELKKHRINRLLFRKQVRSSNDRKELNNLEKKLHYNVAMTRYIHEELRRRGEDLDSDEEGAETNEEIVPTNDPVQLSLSSNSSPFSYGAR